MKTLVFATLDILQLKKLMIMKIFTAQILCTCLSIMEVDKLSTAPLKKKMTIST